uniref:UV-endonuclease UvdE n=1 Tax=Trichuris muris TaxID=70415 RepID=A0A5S6QU72_TRIMR
MAIAELEYHAIIAELVNVDVINIHVGGVYNDKPTAMERFVANFSRLSKEVQDRLTLENDDKQYNPEDVLQLCHVLGVPFVYDVHHHRCTYGGPLPEEVITQTSMAAVSTWKNREPLFHISTPAFGWGSTNPRPHHQMIDYTDFPVCWKSFCVPFTLEVEAKAKEIAVLQLIDALINDGVVVRSAIAAVEESWDTIEIDTDSKYCRKRTRVKISKMSLGEVPPSPKPRTRTVPTHQVTGKRKPTTTNFPADQPSMKAIKKNNDK